jgi:hypothetical protein
MALNFDLLQPANLGAQFMAGRKEAQDVETGRLQQQEARMKLDDFQRKQAGLDKFLAAAKQRGKDGDPVDVADDYYNWTVSQGSPELITQAITLRQTAQQRKDYFASQNPNQLAGVARPVAPAGALGSGTFDPNAPAPSAAAPTNALAPAAAPSMMTSTNALAPTPAPAKQNRIDFIRSELQRLSKYPNVSEAKAEATMLLEEYKRLTTPHVVGDSLMSGEGKVIGTAPRTPTPTNLASLIRERDALPEGNPNRKLYDQQINDLGAAAAASRGNLKVAQDRLAAELSTGNLTPATVDFIAETYRQTGTLPPLGMGPRAAALRSKVLERAAELSMAGNVSAADAAASVKGNKAELAGLTAGQRTAGTQIANVQIAANEANKMIEVAKPYVAAVNPTDYPMLNAAGNYVARNTGDANVVGLATSLNSLVNVYARAINPRGVATVSDKNHAREIINTAMSSGQLNEAFKVMGLEMNAALASGPETRAAMRPGAKPAAAAAPAAGGFKYIGKESN